MYIIKVEEEGTPTEYYGTFDSRLSAEGWITQYFFLNDLYNTIHIIPLIDKDVEE